MGTTTVVLLSLLHFHSLKRKPNWFPIVPILVIFNLLTPTPLVPNCWSTDHNLYVCVRASEKQNRVLWYHVTAWYSPVFYYHVIFQLLHSEEQFLCLCTDCGRHFIAHCDYASVHCCIWFSLYWCLLFFSCFCAFVWAKERKQERKEATATWGKCSLWDLQIKYAL